MADESVVALPRKVERLILTMLDVYEEEILDHTKPHTPFAELGEREWPSMPREQRVQWARSVAEELMYCQELRALLKCHGEVRPHIHDNDEVYAVRLEDDKWSKEGLPMV